jgi:hypothetical protein
MRTNLTSRPLTRCSRFAVAALAACVLVSALVAPTLNAADSNPPNRISYKGFLTDVNGDPLNAGGPLNHTIVFRIYDVLLGGATLWTEQQTVTIDNGVFSVLLGAGTAFQSESRDSLQTVFQGNNASDRFIGITVDSGGTELAPRMRFLTSPYAHLASNAITANSLTGGVVNTVDGGGIVVDNPVATPTPSVGGFDPGWKGLLSGSIASNEWHVMMDHYPASGNLLFADGNNADATEMILYRGSGNLEVKGAVTTGTGGFVVSEASVSPILRTGSSFAPQLKRIYSAHRNNHQWVAMINESSGAIEWGADNNLPAGTANTQMYLGKTGILNVVNAVISGGFIAQSNGFVARNNGFVLEDTNIIPIARTGTFDPVQKRVLSASQANYDWHLMINEANGDLIWGDDAAAPGDRDSEMVLSRTGNLNIEGHLVSTSGGLVVQNANTTPTPLDGGTLIGSHKGFLSATAGGKQWNLLVDTVAGHLVWADGNSASGTEQEMFLNSAGQLWTRGGTHEFSDRRLKKNIKDYGTGILEKIIALEPVSYNWKTSDDNASKDFGLIAQDVRELFPEVVSVTKSSDPELGEVLGISYNKLGVLAVGAIKELHEETRREDALLHEEVESLRKVNRTLSDRLSEVQSRLNALENKFL